MGAGAATAGLLMPHNKRIVAADLQYSLRKREKWHIAYYAPSRLAHNIIIMIIISIEPKLSAQQSQLIFQTPANNVSQPAALSSQGASAARQAKGQTLVVVFTRNASLQVAACNGAGAVCIARRRAQQVAPRNRAAARRAADANGSSFIGGRVFASAARKDR